MELNPKSQAIELIKREYETNEEFKIFIDKFYDVTESWIPIHECYAGKTLSYVNGFSYALNEVIALKNKSAMECMIKALNILKIRAVIYPSEFTNIYNIEDNQIIDLFFENQCIYEYGMHIFSSKEKYYLFLQKDFNSDTLKELLIRLSNHDSSNEILSGCFSAKILKFRPHITPSNVQRINDILCDDRIKHDDKLYVLYSVNLQCKTKLEKQYVYNYLKFYIGFHNELLSKYILMRKTKLLLDIVNLIYSMLIDEVYYEFTIGGNTFSKLTGKSMIDYSYFNYYYE